MELWFQQDAQKKMIDFLMMHSEEENIVGAMLPAKWTPRAGGFITVQSDGVNDAHKAYTGELVRVTVHAIDGVAANKMMREIDALIVTPSMSSALLAATPATGIISGKDSKVGGWFASAVYQLKDKKKVKQF